MYYIVSVYGANEHLLLRYCDHKSLGDAETVGKGIDEMLKKLPSYVERIVVELQPLSRETSNVREMRDTPELVETGDRS